MVTIELVTGRRVVLRGTTPEAVIQALESGGAWVKFDHPKGTVYLNPAHVVRVKGGQDVA